MAEKQSGRDGDIGEDHVRLLATRAGFVVNEPTRDRTGWDKQIEITVHAPPGTPLDKRVADVRAFVQVKTTRGEPVSDIKLDAMDRACKDPAPWCFVFVVVDTAGNPTDVYVVPLDADLMATVLRRLRFEHAKGTLPADLHTKTLAVRASKEHRIEPTDATALRERVLAAVGDPATGPDAKQRLLRTLGYDAAPYIASLGLAEGVTDEDMVDAIIGLRDEVRLSRVTVDEHRFDIPVTVRNASGDLSLRFEPKSIGPTIMSVVDDTGVRSEATFDTFVPSGVGDVRLFKVRCANPLMEVVISRDKPAQLHINLDAEAVLLSDLRAVGRLALALVGAPSSGRELKLAFPHEIEVGFQPGPGSGGLPTEMVAIVEAAIRLSDLLRSLGHDRVADEVVPGELLRLNKVLRAATAALSRGASTVTAVVDATAVGTRCRALVPFALPLRKRTVVVLVAVDGDAQYEVVNDLRRRITVTAAPQLVRAQSLDREPYETFGDRYRELLGSWVAKETVAAAPDCVLLETW